MKRESQHHSEDEGAVPYPEDRELMRRVRRGDAEAFEPMLRRYADAVFRFARFMTADAETARRIAQEAFAETFKTLYPEVEMPEEEEGAGAPEQSGAKEAEPLRSLPAVAGERPASGGQASQSSTGPPAPYIDDFGAWVLSVVRRTALTQPPQLAGRGELFSGLRWPVNRLASFGETGTTTLSPPRGMETGGGEPSGDTQAKAIPERLKEVDIELREALVLRHAEGEDKLSYESIGKVCGVSPDTAAERLAGARHDLARLVAGPSDGGEPAESERADQAEEEPGPRRLATGTGIALYVVLSRHIDGELPPERSEEVEHQLKESARCREEIAALRGADRFAARAVEGVRDPGLVPAVMEALSLYSRAVPMAGRRVPRFVLWGLIVLAALSAGTLVAAGLHALFSAKQKRHRVLDIRVGGPPRVVQENDGPAEEGPRPEWRVRKPGSEAWSEAPPGARVSTGTEIDLPAPGAHGWLARPDGLRLYAEAGTWLAIADDATEERGLTLVCGRVLVDVPKGAGPFELLAGGTRLSFDSPPARVFINQHSAEEPCLCVLAGSVRFAYDDVEFVLEEGEGLSFGGGLPNVPLKSPIPELRRFALDFIPPPLRPSAWPARGGSPARSGHTPFDFGGPPVRRATLEGVAGASAVVLGKDGTGYFLAGPPPGRLIRIDAATGDEIGRSVPFASPCTGDPVVGPDGRIYVCTRDGRVLAFDPPSRAIAASSGGGPAADTDALETVVPPSPGDLPRTGPTVGPDGSIYVVYAGGLAAFSPDGTLRWRRKDILAGAPPSVGPEGTVFIASLGGRLHVLEAATGRDLAGEELSAGEAFMSHVAVGPGGTAYAVSARGKLLWYSADGAFGTVALPESDYALAPAVAGGGEVVVASSTGTVYRLSARPTFSSKGGRRPAPFFAAGEPVGQGPLVDASGRVLLITQSGALVTIEPTGRSRTVELGARGATPPAIGPDGTLVIVTRDGRVFAGRSR